MKKTSKIIALLSAVILTAAIFAGCSDSDPLVMATNAEFPPYGYYNENNEIVGIDVEIAQAIAKKLGKKLEIEDMPFDSILAAVQSGKADIGVAGMTVTPDRLESVDFSDTYVKASQVIIVRKDNTEIKTPDDLVGKTIGVQLGTTGDIFAEEIDDVKLERYNKGFEAVQALQQGKIDAVIIDDQPAAVFASQNDDIMVIDEPFTDEEYAIAVIKGNTALLNKINEAIKELKESGELQRIFEKYIMN